MKRKPYYETPLGKLYHGDCLEIMPQLEPVDLVLTDIPYDGVNRETGGLRKLNKGRADIKTFEIQDFISSLMKICRGAFYIFCFYKQVTEICNNFEKHGLSIRQGVWLKSNPSPMNGQHIWTSGIENIIYGKNAGATHNVHCKPLFFKYPSSRNALHETQKPSALFQEIVLASSNIEDCVLDTCFGSGTTGFVSERLNRKWIGIEIEEKYCEIAAKRIEQERKQLKLF